MNYLSVGTPIHLVSIHCCLIMLSRLQTTRYLCCTTPVSNDPINPKPWEANECTLSSRFCCLFLLCLSLFLFVGAIFWHCTSSGNLKENNPSFRLLPLKAVNKSWAAVQRASIFTGLRVTLPSNSWPHPLATPRWQTRAPSAS